jgi:hypothetical protein
MTFLPCATTNRCSQGRCFNANGAAICGKKCGPFWGGDSIYRCGISICFRPNRRASRDHAPGPIIASAAPEVASMMGVPTLPAPEKAIHTSTTVINVPQIGVHRPRSRSVPAPAPIICGKNEANCGASRNCSNPRQKRNVAVTTRCRSRPLPGQLFGNAENRRCTSTRVSGLELRLFATSSKPPNEGLGLLLSGELQLDNSSF